MPLSWALGCILFGISTFAAARFGIRFDLKPGVSLLLFVGHIHTPSAKYHRYRIFLIVVSITGSYIYDAETAECLIQRVRARCQRFR